jgi:hypothetical protein
LVADSVVSLLFTANWLSRSEAASGTLPTAADTDSEPVGVMPPAWLASVQT